MEASRPRQSSEDFAGTIKRQKAEHGFPVDVEAGHELSLEKRRPPARLFGDRCEGGAPGARNPGILSSFAGCHAVCPSAAETPFTGLRRDGHGGGPERRQKERGLGE